MIPTCFCACHISTCLSPTGVPCFCPTTPPRLSLNVSDLSVYTFPLLFCLFSTNEKTRSTSPRQSARWPVYNSYTRYTLKNIILLYVGRRDEHKNLH